MCVSGEYLCWQGRRPLQTARLEHPEAEEHPLEVRECQVARVNVQAHGAHGGVRMGDGPIWSLGDQIERRVLQVFGSHLRARPCTGVARVRSKRNMAPESFSCNWVRGDGLGQHRVPVAAQEVETSRTPTRRSARRIRQTRGGVGLGGSKVRAGPPPPQKTGYRGDANWGSKLSMASIYLQGKARQSSR